MKRPRRKSRLTRQQKILTAIAAMLAVLLVLVLVYQGLFVRPELGNKPPSGGGSTTVPVDYGEGVRPKGDGTRKSKDYYTVLILGRDTGGGGNTDTMLLASYDVTNQKASVMSIPRDTMVNVSWDVKKINSVYNFRGRGEKGIQGLYQEISQLVGFEPDYQVIVEWEAVGKIVEAMGGVMFDVPYEMKYKDPLQDLYIDQAKGLRKLSGEDAMQVIRWRKNNRGIQLGDVERIKIQQDFLKAVLTQMLQVQNVANINKFAKVFNENVETDLSIQNIFWFGKQAVFGGLSMENVNFVTMPYKLASCYSPSVGQKLSYVTPIAGELLALVNESLSPFTEKSTLGDLDIMSVNADGSISSTTGHVEDKRAAVPPNIPSHTPTAPPDDPTVGEEIPPVTGEITPPTTGETVPPTTVETTPPVTTPPTTGGTTPPVTTPPVTPPVTTPPVTPPVTTPPTTPAEPTTPPPPTIQDPAPDGT